MKMKGKVSLVTGAALGYKNGGPSIGSAIAFKMVSEGAKVVVVDINEKMGQKTTEKIIKNGGKSIFVKCDVSKTEDVKKVIENTQKEFGELHCLVNCAASYEGDIFKNVVETPEKDWKHIIDVNLNGYYRFAKYGIPLILKSGGGTVVNISSAAAFEVLKNFSVYPVTKAAINSLTRTIAIDFAPEIRCNAICPGFVRIANSENNRSEKELKEWVNGISKTYPLKRVCSVDEIANVVLFLASEESSYINGECIVVDGGRSVSDSHEF
ncbi:MAG: SDR family oxidoreductase [Candidatus Aenigmarchaeota archaeon]|nr:SDR family oxidoreductase [Candidatus Aenigmarchaeota archaeon]